MSKANLQVETEIEEPKEKPHIPTYEEIEGDMLAKRRDARKALRKLAVKLESGQFVYPSGILPPIGSKKLFIGYFPMLCDKDGLSLEPALTAPNGWRYAKCGMQVWAQLKPFDSPEDAMEAWNKGAQYFEIPARDDKPAEQPVVGLHIIPTGEK